jgi:hypothetical protein
MSAALCDDRKQVRVRHVANHQHVRVEKQARIEEPGRQDRTADDGDVGQLAQRAARLARPVDGAALVDRFGRADVRDQQPRTFADGRGGRRRRGRRAHDGRRGR